MFKTILAFIKAHTIATAITATVVVSTVVATPIIINQAQKPKQEIETGQVQENIIDNTVIDNTVEENTETPEENITDENTTVPEEEQKVETPKEENKQDQNKNQATTKPTTPSSNSGTTKPTTNNNKTETPSQSTIPSNKVVKFTVGSSTISYDEVNKVVGSTDFSIVCIPRNNWLVREYLEWRNSILGNIDYYHKQDIAVGNYTQEYCQKKVAQYAEEVYRYQGALEYLKLHENNIEEISNENNEFLYEGKYYTNYAGTLEGCIRVASQNKADWEQTLKTAPQIGALEAEQRAILAELEKAYNYIKSH